MANTVRVGLYDRSRVESYTIHTIVYALPPAWDDWHGLLRRTSHKTIQFLGAKKTVSSYSGCRETRGLVLWQWVRREDMRLCRPELQRKIKCMIEEKFLAILFTDLQRLSRSRNYFNSRFRCDTNTYKHSIPNRGQNYFKIKVSSYLNW